MVTKRWLEEKWLNPWLERQKAKNFAKGRADERHRWTEWNQRRMEAKSRGAPFDEPPPAP